MAIGKKLLGFDYLQALAPSLYAQSQRFRTTILLITFINVLFSLRMIFHNSWLPFLFFNLLSIVSMLSYIFYRVSMYLYDRRLRQGENSSIHTLNEIIQSLKKALEGFFEYSNISFLMKVIGQYDVGICGSVYDGDSVRFIVAICLFPLIDLEWIVENLGIPQLKQVYEKIKWKLSQIWGKIWVKIPRYNPSKDWGSFGHIGSFKSFNSTTSFASGRNLPPSPTFPIQNIKQIVSEYVPTFLTTNQSQKDKIQTQQRNFSSDIPQGSTQPQSVQTSNQIDIQPISTPVTHIRSAARPAVDQSVNFQYTNPDQSFTSYHTAQAHQQNRTLKYPLKQPQNHLPIYYVPGVPPLHRPPVPIPMDTSLQTIPKNEPSADNSAELSFRSIPMATPQEQLQTLKSPLNLHF